MSENTLCDLQDRALTIIVLGASGDLAWKKTYPALHQLFRAGLLPSHATIVGYARSDLDIDDFRTRIRRGLEVDVSEPGEAESADNFLAMCEYVSGQYDSESDVADLAAICAGYEADRGTGTVSTLTTPVPGKGRGKGATTAVDDKKAARPCGGEPDDDEDGANRIFYFALPPSVFADIAKAIHSKALSKKGFNRLIIEKPFGHDLASSDVLSEQLLDLFPEESLFRCDHYLHKQLVQTLTTLRFGNAIYEPLWNREHISCVMITMKEAIGTEGRGGYFDGIGIIRDVVQNHLLQVLSLIAMEAPASHDSEDVRDAKTELLKCIREISTSEVVLGQFEGWVKKEPSRKITQLGYLDEDGVPADSKCATFATLVLEIDNDRWRGVPFIIKAGKALNERKTEVRIQFKPPRTQVFDPATLARNELVLRVQPKEAVYMKIVSKRPSLADKLIETELDLSFGDRYSGVRVPEAYERLIYNVLKGRRELFVRSDELREAWKLFTPLLNRIDAGEVEVHKYPFGSRGPEASDELIKRHGYVRSETYTWKK
eukprot:TRINITY_DN2329_c0_g1_i1.p1 TRINITY_DN2329_c0_g1~~TRINITY_DN2329_c0_g1_i1.p1  ORF type:complete len:544 (-),score=285.33 TRINITY_DN2329_c0_g1_i1:8-1639(-)